MKFNDVTHLVEIDSLNKEEAKVFVLFIQSEVARHLQDINYAHELIRLIKVRHGLK